MKNQICLESVRATAEKYYREGDFYCSEAVVKTLIDAFEIDVSDDVVKTASGFPVGIGGAGCTCGALSGGIIVIGIVFGRKTPQDPAINKAMELSAKLHAKFLSLHKTTCCRSLTRWMMKGSDKHMKQCTSFTGEMAVETAKIIADELGLEI